MPEADSVDRILDSPSRRRGGRPARARVLRTWTITALRALVLATAAVVLCWPLTIPPGLAAAGAGAFLGAFAGDRAARSRLRLASGLGLALLALLLGTVLARAIVGTTLPSRILGPVVALGLGEAVLWLSVLAPLVFALRLTAQRRPALAVLEVLAVAAATATGFAAHRDGMVHRPLLVGDWAWSRGLDPALVFLVLGGLATLLMAALLIQEGRKRRLPLHFAGLLLVALALVLFVRVEGLPKPDPAGDLGLTGEPEKGEGDEGDARRARDRRGQGRGDGRGDQHQLGDLEFQDDYGDSGEQTPLAVVLLHDDYSPPPGVYYFRQTAFSQYNGRRLVQATRDDVDRDIVHRFPFREERVADAPPARGGRKALVTTVGLMVDHVRPFALDSPAVLRPAPNPNPMRFQRTFEVRSHVQVTPYDDLLGRRSGDPRWSEETWQHYLEAPSDPRYGELARSVLDRVREEYRNEPIARALAVKLYLDENGIYSRKSRHADTPDPAASFLFGDLTGYCVHFAHAAAYLFRSLDIPARVSAGYAVGENERQGGSAIVIRGGSAHAWPEIYLEDIGWVVVDLTPEQSLEEPMESPDPRLQQMLGEMMRQGKTQDDFGDQARQPFDWRALLERLAWLLALVLAVCYTVKIYRRFVPSLAGDGQLWRLGYRATLDRLAEVGLVRRFGESREGFARRVGRAVPSFPPLTGLHVGRALGSGHTAELAASGAAVRRFIDGVGHELRQGVPFWRRLLGWLHPLSWLRVK
ncbi:MAG: transglutaminase domain-containing protein [Holophagales bacterium]|nr:transglutaminase domain-containing protein [Holophagales bacterium]